CFKRPFNSSIKPLIPIPKSTTKAMDKDQLKVFIDFITKGFKNVAKELKSSSSGGNNITRWNATGYANSSFVPCFLKKFSTEEKQNMWHHQLNEL
ncbi:14695_t:CDS:2, partial [Funneliformis geosporum]